MTDQSESAGRRPSLLEHYRRVLSRHEGDKHVEGNLESGELDPSTIDDRLEDARSALHRIVRTHLGDSSDLYQLADQIAADGKEGMLAVTAGDAARLEHPDVLAGLEVIVQTDGSRPSFMVRNGMPDLTTSPVGDWKYTFDDEPDKLQAALSCVGRIDDPTAQQGFHGTGWLVSENLVMTNRHVLQGFASQDRRTGDWTIKPDIEIDFGHEFRARMSLKRRKIVRVVFAGSSPIAGTSIDHSKLDLALLELAPAAPGDQPEHVLAFDPAPDWGHLQQPILTIGYPGDPGITAGPPSLLELLFKSTFGCKRVAPGFVTTIADRLEASPRVWTLGHDATTLGGNSGSAIVLLGRKQCAVGLHFGGRRSNPRENWCHVLGRTLEETDGWNSKTLESTLLEHRVQFFTELPPEPFPEDS